tara:strand:- start:6559 stop:6906 length:348 start_codon:yes stop_codon:yes gene_type:complete
MKYYIVKEIQSVSVEYLVRADSLVEAKAKAKVIDQDVAELTSHPVFVETISYTGEKVDKDEDDIMVVAAMKRIELNYEVLEPEKPKKPVKKRGAKAKKENSASLLEMVEKRHESK